MNKKREELEKEYGEATAKLEQYQHRGQRYENRILAADGHAGGQPGGGAGADGGAPRRGGDALAEGAACLTGAL